MLRIAIALGVVVVAAALYVATPASPTAHITDEYVGCVTDAAFLQNRVAMAETERQQLNAQGAKVNPRDLDYAIKSVGGQGASGAIHVSVMPWQ